MTLEELLTIDYELLIGRILCVAAVVMVVAGLIVMWTTWKHKEYRR